MKWIGCIFLISVLFSVEPHRLSPNSLNRYAYKVYSQNGEDGMIEEIFRRLKIEKGFFADFGAADGIALSNTRYLWEKGWSGVMIDNSHELFKMLKDNYKEAENVLCLRYTIVDGISNYGVTFDQIARKYFPDQEIDFLSIDIDGLDYLILKSLKCRPKVICIESNLYWHPLFHREVPQEIARGNLQQPLSVMIQIGRDLGYEPIAMTINLFLVRRDLYEPFKDTPSDPLTLWRDGFRSNECRECIVGHRASNLNILRYEDPWLEPITLDY
ncbi:MAG: hypothetical protein A3E80_05580 [Chlamydiae bacterium RIFCSPHIGHO2_12_FULL_49_9]|nr:MAG: hypothetical protein A3E80_05580 [Chlamydiae bacterium RIFCSPHIGHO2_12_FULL_49_9]